MAGAPRSWSDLPLDLAGLVLGRLLSHVDRVRFAAVCPQWRSAARQVRLPPPLPLLALKRGGTFYSMPRGEPLRFTGCDDGFATVSGNWLVYRRSHCLLLVDPFSGATMTLPAPSSVCLPDKGDDGSDDDDDIAFMNALDIKDFLVVKLIVRSPDLVAALFWSGYSCRIAVCRPGASLWSVAWDLCLWVTDMAFYQGKLYATNDAEGLLALDISMDENTGDPQVALIGQVIKGNYRTNFKVDFTFRRMLYLVESHGSLLMVRRRIFHGRIHDKGQIHTFDEQCEPELAVFEADLGRSRWAKVMTLGDDQALFLGPCSRAVCMPQCDSLDKRVWFLDDYKKYQTSCSLSSGTNDMAIRKFSCPLPMISWKGQDDCAAGAMWLFPPN